MRTLPQRRRQHGAALLTAMIIVALVATLSAAMVWQQWRAVQVEAAERARVQSAWILSGALDWAKLILREDLKADRQKGRNVDDLGEPWAVPLAEARLSTFLAADKDNNADEGEEAFLSGSITDAQSRYNLRNLVDNAYNVSPAEVKALQQLLQAINVDTGLAERIALGLRDALAPPAGNGTGASAAPLLPRSVAQLGWLGVDADAIRSMAPYVVLLPVATAVNVNTAPAEVLVAAVPGLDPGTARRIVQARQQAPFKNLPEFDAQLPAALVGSYTAGQAGIASKFFEVRGRLRLEDRVLEESSLVERQGTTILTRWRQRESSRESSE
jgi:general secretion pathway protein K